MDTSSMLGILMGTILLLVGMILEGDLRIFWSFSSILIVFGSTFASRYDQLLHDQVRSVFSWLESLFPARQRAEARRLFPRW